MSRLLSAVFLLLAASVASAQQRPLTTEDPETIGAGRVLLETGLDYAREAEYPVSGLEGTFRFTAIGVVGISSMPKSVDGGSTPTEHHPATRAARDMVTATGLDTQH